MLAERLLIYLRGALGVDGLQFADGPIPVSGGYETSIYTFRLTPDSGLEAPLVLRLFRGHEDPARASFEKAVHDTLADHGYPVPRVRFACTDPALLGGAFVVMERIEGRTLLEDFFRLTTVLRLRTRVFGFVSSSLASLQLRLHSIDPGALRRALSSAGLPEKAGPGRASQQGATFAGQLETLQYRIGHARLDGLHAGMAWLRSHAPPEREVAICHGDFHPLNVLSERGVIHGVIDWQLATIASPAFDVGNTLMLLKLAPGGRVPDGLRRATVWRYLRAYSSARALDELEVEYYEAYRCLRSLVWAGETHQAAAGVIADRGANPWHPPEVAARLIERFREISGVTLRLPT